MKQREQRRPFRAVVAFIMLLGSTITAGLCSQCLAAAQDPGVTIKALVDQIRSEPDRSKRYEAGNRLEKVLTDLDRIARGGLTPEIVDEVASLLVDHDDIIRAYAAGMLAHIGVPAALRAVGPLLRALRDAKANTQREYRMASYNATDAIIGALHALQVCVVPPERHDRDVCNDLLQ